MKPVTKEILKDAAQKLMFDMSEEEYDTLLKEFNIITEQMNLMSKIDNIDNVEPMVFPFDVTNDFLREDEPEKSLSNEEALKNASDVVEGQIRLPKVVG